MHSMKTSTSWWTHLSCSVRISSRPVRSPMCTSRRCVWPPNARCDMWPDGVRSKIAAPLLELAHAVGRLLGVQLGHAPVVDELAARRSCPGSGRSSSSAASTLPSAAAIPPSAITVCALPSSDLQTSAVVAPSADDSIAARIPAPPAPITTTSWSCVSRSIATSEDPRVVEDAGRGEADVEVGETRRSRG